MLVNIDLVLRHTKHHNKPDKRKHVGRAVIYSDSEGEYIKHSAYKRLYRSATARKRGTWYELQTEDGRYIKPGICRCFILLSDTPLGF